MTEAEKMPAAEAGRGLSEGLGPAPERATCECCAFMHAATREAQAFASHYADEVLELRAEVARLRAALVELTRMEPPPQARANTRAVIYGHRARDFALRVLEGPNVRAKPPKVGLSE